MVSLLVLDNVIDWFYYDVTSAQTIYENLPRLIMDDVFLVSKTIIPISRDFTTVVMEKRVLFRVVELIKKEITLLLSFLQTILPLVYMLVSSLTLIVVIYDVISFIIPFNVITSCKNLNVVPEVVVYYLIVDHFYLSTVGVKVAFIAPSRYLSRLMVVTIGIVSILIVIHFILANFCILRGNN